MLERQVRLLTRILWVLVGVAELALLGRVLAVLVWGINGDLSAPSDAPGFIYGLTGSFVNDLADAANFLVPFHGVRHALDIAAIMGMAIVFFGALAATKLALWFARGPAQRSRTPSR